VPDGCGIFYFSQCLGSIFVFLPLERIYAMSLLRF
jgi:hypothetical protein